MPKTLKGNYSSNELYYITKKRKTKEKISPFNIIIVKLDIRTQRKLVFWEVICFLP